MAVGRNQDTTQGDPVSRYGDELLSANWNPAIDLLGRAPRGGRGLDRAAPEKLREEDAATFLGRIYTLGA